MRWFLMFLMFPFLAMADDIDRIAWQRAQWCPVGVASWHQVHMQDVARYSDQGLQLTALCDQARHAGRGEHHLSVYVPAWVNDELFHVEHVLGPFEVHVCEHYELQLEHAGLGVTRCRL